LLGVAAVAPATAAAAVVSRTLPPSKQHGGTAMTGFAKGDPAACHHFAPATLRVIKSGTGYSCPDFVRYAHRVLIKPSDESAIARIRPTVLIDGDRAEVRYRVSPTLAKIGFRGTTLMKKSGGRWLIEPKQQ
jgi:hypothetical protein